MLAALELFSCRRDVELRASNLPMPMRLRSSRTQIMSHSVTSDAKARQKRCSWGWSRGNRQVRHRDGTPHPFPGCGLCKGCLRSIRRSPAIKQEVDHGVPSDRSVARTCPHCQPFAPLVAALGWRTGAVGVAPVLLRAHGTSVGAREGRSRATFNDLSRRTQNPSRAVLPLFGALLKQRGGTHSQA